MCKREYDKQHMINVAERKNYYTVNNNVKMLNKDKTMLIEIDVIYSSLSSLKQLCSLVNMITNFNFFLN